MADDPNGIAQRYPNLAPLADDLEEILATISSCNRGYGDVKFSAQGLDPDGRLQIKYIDAQVRKFRKKIS